MYHFKTLFSFNFLYQEEEKFAKINTMDFKNKLNEKQYLAVTSSSQYLRIIAGAGSGKTRVLTYRIAYLISEEGYRPGEVLAITFTNKVAKEMRERTKELLPDYDLSFLQIQTFHAWCAFFLRREIRLLGFPSHFQILDDDDQTLLIKNIAEELGYKRSDEIVKKALSYIGTHKTYGRLPSDLKDVKAESKVLLEFFKKYEEKKNLMFSLDFDDLLIYAINILASNPEIREKYSRYYRSILVDEFQDTNDLQFKLLTLLASSRTSIYVVGDPDQTIYTWRGANQKIILEIEKYFAPLETIILNENYRSTSNILKGANLLIDFNKERVKKDLFTNNDQGDDILLKALDTKYSEARFVVNKIKELNQLTKSNNLKRYAILYRSSYLSLPFENLLTENRLSYKVYGGTKFYARKEIKDVLSYFKLLMNHSDDISFERIINVPRRKIGKISIADLKAAASSNSLSLYDFILNSHTLEHSIRGGIISTLYELIKKMEVVERKIKENLEAYSEVLHNFLIDIGYIKYLSDDEDNEERILNVKALIDEIRNFNKQNDGAPFSEYLQNVTLLSAQDDIDDSNSVTLMTVHTAKGLEYDYVFVVGMNEGVFPNARATLQRGYEGLEEERRLAYVAFTRAKVALFVSYNRDYNYSTKTYGTPSNFIKEAQIKEPFTYTHTVKDKVSSLYDQIFGQKEVKAATTLNEKNNIIWKVGDHCHHTNFGDGVIIEVNGDILDVNFENFGLKKMLGTHKFLSKKED